jgi:hypothetical protein
MEIGEEARTAVREPVTLPAGRPRPCLQYFTPQQHVAVWQAERQASLQQYYYSTDRWFCG